MADMARAMSKVRTGLRILGSWVVYFLSYAVPRNRSLWVFYGWHSDGEKKELLADNGKYTFLYSSIQGKSYGIKSVWIGTNERLLKQLRERGYLAARRNSIAGMWYALRAGYTFVDAYLALDNWRYSGRTRIIQLWHGVPIKKTGHQSPYAFKNKNLSGFLFPHLRAKDRIFITTSAWETAILNEAFPSVERRFVQAGHARNDVINTPMQDSDIDAAVIPETKRSKKILYCPTFRPDGSNPADQLHLEQLAPVLKKHDAVLYIQMHPKLASYEPRWSEDISASVCLLKGSKDVYPILSQFDVCITDYSSLCFDFLFLDRPILYYQPDLSTYTHEMGLQDSYEKLLAGPQTTNFEGLQKELISILEGNDTYASVRKRVFDLTFKYHDSRSSERIFNMVCDDANIQQ